MHFRNYFQHTKLELTNNMHHHLKSTLTSRDSSFLQNCIGKSTSFVRFFSPEWNAVIMDPSGLLISSGYATIYFSPSDRESKSEDFLCLKINFVPVAWSIFGEYGVPMMEWSSIRGVEQYIDQKNYMTRTINPCIGFNIGHFRIVQEVKIYGVEMSGQRSEEDSEEFAGHTFNADLDLLISFLFTDGMVLAFSFVRLPEVSEGTWMRVCNSEKDLIEGISPITNHLGEPLFQLKQVLK